MYQYSQIVSLPWRMRQLGENNTINGGPTHHKGTPLNAGHHFLAGNTRDNDTVIEHCVFRSKRCVLSNQPQPTELHYVYLY
jgi:hypothetical protein